MRKMLAEVGSRYAEFLIDLINYADNTDVRIFLDNIFVYDKLKDSDIPKVSLIKHLFYYVDNYIDLHIGGREDLLQLKKKYIQNGPYFNPSIPFVENVYVPLYLNLYALSENFYSYRITTSKDLSMIETINIAYNFLSKEARKVYMSKNGSPAKLMHMLIKSYIENKFYYSFFNDKLLKIEIKSKITSKKNEKTNRMYKESIDTFVFTEYKLEDKNGETFVINNNIGVNESLGMLLVRNKYIPDDSIEYFVDYASKSISFTDTTKLHNKIVQILKYKKYKGAAVTDKNIAKFHGKCEDLLKKLKEIQQNINPEVENDYISVFPTFEFEDIIFKIDPSEKFSDMREFRHNRKNKLNDYILELEQEIKIEDDEYMYGDLLKQIENIKSIIEDVFK